MRTQAPLKTNSNEVVRECLLEGVGIALRSTWDIGPELREGRLQILLPQYRASKDVGLYAVYPSRQFLPAKVRVYIDFLARLYGSSPYWDAGLDDWLRLPSSAQAG